MAGPFWSSPLEGFGYFPLEWFRLTHQLSYPAGALLNNGINQDLLFCILCILWWCCCLGQAKTNIVAAFHLLPICPDDFHLLGCRGRVSFLLTGASLWLAHCFWRLSTQPGYSRNACMRILRTKDRIIQFAFGKSFLITYVEMWYLQWQYNM